MKFPERWLEARTIHRMVQVDLREVLQLAVWLGIAFSVLLAIPFAFYYQAETANTRALLQGEQERIVRIAVGAIYQEMETALSDLRYLSQHNEVKDYMQGRTAADRLDLAREYLGLSMQKRIYDQIRFIGTDGKETVRVDFNGGRPVVVAEENLRDRSDRYYFSEAMQLLPGQIYVSPFDLNQPDDGQRPRIPVIRFATPIADQNGNVQGIVVLNYLGQRLRDRLRALESETGRIRLVNSTGHWLMAASPEDEWVFMFPDRSQRSLRELSPQLWHKMQREWSGVYRTEDAWVRFERVYPLLGEYPNPVGTGFSGPVNADRYYWTLAVELLEPAMRNVNVSLLQKLGAAYAVLVVFAFVLAGALAFAMRRNRSLAQVMEKVVDNVPVLVAYVDADERYRFNNMAYERFFGLSPKRIYGKTMRELLGEAAYAVTEAHIKEALGGKTVVFERKLPYAGAGPRDAVITYLPDVTPQGVRGFYVMVNDVTAIRNSQRRERQHMLELAHVSRLASMGEMATQIAHEINQPLAAIAMYAAAAQRTMQGACEREKIETWLEAINTQAKRASEIVRRVRQFVQKGEPHLEAVDLNTVLRETAALVEHEAKTQNVQIVLDLADELPPARGEKVLLEQVVLNLVRNAMDAVVTGGGERRVTLKTSADAHLVYVEVSDTGPGVDPALGQHIFDSFVTGKQGGLGMGLAISRSIVEAHAGTLRYATNPEGGAAFTFSLAQEAH